MKGFDDFAKKLKELEKFATDINGELGSVTFDAFDAESIEHAIIEMEKMIDEKAQIYSRNPMIQEMVIKIKEDRRQAIIDAATELRIQTEDE